MKLILIAVFTFAALYNLASAAEQEEVTPQSCAEHDELWRIE